jgi:hypothetical protein
MPIPLRVDFDAQATRAAARRSKDGPQARRLLALAAIYDGATRTAAARIGGVTLQIVRDWVLKFNAHGPDGLIDRKAPGSRPGSMTRTGRRLPRSSRVGRRQRSMASCAGGSSIFANGCTRSSGSRSPSRRSAGNCAPWAIANSRPARAIMRRPRARSRILKNIPRPRGAGRRGQGRRSGRNRNLVRRRGAHRPEEQDHAALGQARNAPLRGARPAHRLDLHLRRDLPEGGQRRGARPSRLQHRGDEPAPRRNRHGGRPGQARHPAARSGRLAYVDPPDRSAEHHARPAITP